MKRVLVNAIPLINVNTGIGRYLRCLYGEMEKQFAHKYEFHYFDGVSVSRDMPTGPSNLPRWSLMTQLFWKLPPTLSLLIRIALQQKRQRAFSKVATGFDVYHEAGFFPFIPPDGVKTVFTIHDMSIFRYPQHHPRERVLFMERYLKKRAKTADAILTVSHFSRQEIKRYIEDMDVAVHVTHLGVARSFIPREGKELRATLKKYGLPDRYFLFVGSGDPRKNADLIPRALKEAKLQIPLISVGWSGWENQANDSHVLSIGYVPDQDLAEIYSGATALVFPSTYEGFGLPVAEAMACGCPVITTRESSLPEVGGEAAWYLDDPGSSRELAKLLTMMTQVDDRAALARAAREQAANFKWSKTARKTCDVFDQVLDQ